MDRISGLSDELLVKILLFVPTKVAVSTSVLSKRWEYLWTWLPKLKYGHKDSSFSECESLQFFLNQNLPLHRAPVLESFSLDLTSGIFKPEDTKLWILIAVFHCVRELEFISSSYFERLNILPRNLYTCESLVILKLQGKILLDVPRMVYLPSLKTLELRSVIYFNEESLQRLLSNCPILEGLLVDFREKDVTRKLTVAVPSLLRLSLCIPYNHDIEEVVIVTPALTNLELQVYKNHCFLIEIMPNLIEAYIDVALPNINSLIRSITHVKRLTICSKATYDEDSVFNQLEHLEVCRCKEHTSNLLVKLLNDSSNLQILDLFFMDYHEPVCVANWNQPSTVPKCMLSSLQTLRWSAYTGDLGERDLAAYILGNAVHLMTARITFLERGVPKFEMLEELAFFSRASTTCNLIIE